MTEDQIEQKALGWLTSVGYTQLNARDPDLALRLISNQLSVIDFQTTLAT